jgi:hypothetical protein
MSPGITKTEKRRNGFLTENEILHVIVEETAGTGDSAA